ncbi:Cytidylate kinase [Thermomonospora echinospora]|uniref:Cytidylate kinase n=1 Tax=Thermomonospora echinospora TaxID=1992 RepID=A0A1H5VTM2_9ACTN|nr:cytidylate kinase-like family protein [Thermomonospora echinospora]SEF90642.1 Cytidylate kinase [Thermomonospora echinospora]
MPARVVTLSATFGAGGSVIGPAVAERLGVPFVDRAVPATVAAEIGCTLEEALAHDDRAEHGLGRILAGAARVPVVALGGMDVHLSDRALVPAEEFVARTEQVIRQIADGGGVILGRAAAVVLGDRLGVLHVRLDGPVDRRLERALRDFADEPGPGPGRERTEAERRRSVRRALDDNDRARTAYVRHFYRVDPASPRLYHLVIDSTRLPVDAVTELIVSAADAV